MAAGRQSPIKGLLANYRQIIAPKDESTRYRNPIFRRGLSRRCYEETNRGIGHSVARWPRMTPNFHSATASQRWKRRKRPAAIRQRRGQKFQHENKLFADYSGKEQVHGRSRTAQSTAFGHRQSRGSQLSARTHEEKTGIQLEHLRRTGRRDWSKVPENYNNAKQKLAQSLFMEFRSRKSRLL